jgi:hypothetical protein
MKYDLKEMVTGNKVARFTHFRHNQLWYETENGFRFAVPIEDIGDATFVAEEKAILMMRYIRKQLEVYNLGE